ncbi:WD40-repeat-containing domain protein [Melanogaster broomeanus]|nr:WD40-repeat-containing domain protein [Melanogaster broomeanus]
MPSSSQAGSLENASHRVPMQAFEGHEERVRCVHFYPDGNRLVSGSDDNTLRIWNRETGAVEALSGHTDAVCEVDVSHDGKMVVSGSADKTVRIWNGVSGEPIHAYKGHGKSVLSVQFAADSNRVVSGSYDHTVRVWLVETGKLAFEPIRCNGAVWCVRFSPSGDRIASGASSVQIWDAKTGNGILTIEDSSVYSLAWTHSEQILGGRYRNIALWNSHNGELLRTWKAHHNWSRLSLSPTGTHLATCAFRLGIDNIVSVFDISTGKQVAAFDHGQSVIGIAYSPSGRYIAIGGHEKVYMWDPIANEEDPQSKSSEPSAPSFSSHLDPPSAPPPAETRQNAVREFTVWASLPDAHVRISLCHFTHESQYFTSHSYLILPPLVVRKPYQQLSRKTYVPASLESSSVRLTQLRITQNPIGETGERVQVAAGRDRTVWEIITSIAYTPMKWFLYMLICCRKSPVDAEIAENPNAKPDPSETPAGDDSDDPEVITKQPEGHEISDASVNSTISPHTSLQQQPMPATSSNSSGRDASSAPSSSAPSVLSIPLST